MEEAAGGGGGGLAARGPLWEAAGGLAPSAGIPLKGSAKAVPGLAGGAALDLVAGAALDPAAQALSSTAAGDQPKEAAKGVPSPATEAVPSPAADGSPESVAEAGGFLLLSDWLPARGGGRAGRPDGARLARGTWERGLVAALDGGSWALGGAGHGCTGSWSRHDWGGRRGFVPGGGERGLDPRPGRARTHSSGMRTWPGQLPWR
ncbi:hypothetical protein ACP4OV_007013 [Aristida adscensionis]